MPEHDHDIDLMKRVQADDERAFRQLFFEYRSRIVNFARRYFAGDQARSEEAAQEAFLRLYRARHSYQPQTKFSTYFYSIVINVCLNEKRRIQEAPISDLQEIETLK